MRGLKIRLSKLFVQLLLLFDIVALAFLLQAWPELRAYFNQVQMSRIRERGSGVFITDFNRDSEEEIVYLSSQEPFPYQRLLTFFCPFRSSASNELKYNFELLSKDVVTPPGDIDGDGDPEIPILGVREDAVVLKLLDIEGKSKREIAIPLSPTLQGREFIVVDAAYEDLNGDNESDLIVFFGSGWFRQPRGIVVFDLANKRLLWEFLFGCAPEMMRVLDVNADGEKEVLFSGRSPHNFVTVNGISDDFSYLILLDRRGQVLWKDTLGGYYTRIFFDVGDLDQDGRLEIITSKDCHRDNNPEPGEIRLIDPGSGKTTRIRTEAATEFGQIFLKRVGDQPLLFVGDSRGRVSTLDSELNPLKSIQLPAPAVVKGIYPLGREGKEEFVFVQSSGGRLSVHDLNLGAVREFGFKEYPNVQEILLWPIRNRSEQAVLVNADSLSMIRKEPVSGAAFRRFLLGSRWAAYLLLLLGINVFLVYFERRRRTAELALKHPELEHMTAVAQEISHRLKGLLFTIQLEAERLRTALQENGASPPGAERGLAKSPQSILDDVAAMKQRIRTLMQFLESKDPQLAEVDLNGLLRKIIQKYAEVLEGRITFELDLDREHVRLTLDADQIEEALTNIIQNAVEAIPEKGRIRVTANAVSAPFIRSRRGVELEIEDTGCGIPAERLADIFKPYSTSKQGGAGIGLTITKKIIEAHGGRIRVQSRVGVGTRIAVFLPQK